MVVYKFFYYRLLIANKEAEIENVFKIYSQQLQKSLLYIWVVMFYRVLLFDVCYSFHTHTHTHIHCVCASFMRRELSVLYCFIISTHIFSNINFHFYGVSITFVGRVIIWIHSLEHVNWPSNSLDEAKLIIACSYYTHNCCCFVLCLYFGRLICYMVASFEFIMNIRFVVCLSRFNKKLYIYMCYALVILVNVY